MSSPTTSRTASCRRPSQRLLAHLAAVALLSGLALAAAACGSSASPTTTSGAGGATTTTGGGSSSTSSQPPTGNAALAQLGSKISAGQSATFVATYALKSTQSGKTDNGTFTIAHQGSNTLFGGTFAQGSFEEIVKPSKSTVCAKQAGQWRCFSGAFGAAIGKSISPLINSFSPRAELAKLKADAGGAYDTSTSTRTLAGQSVSCVTFRTHSGNGTFTVCVTPQGIPAELLGTNSSGHFSLVLSKFTASVPSSEFTPPAK